MIPGISAADKKQIDSREGEKLIEMKAIIQSMTNAERESKYFER